MIIFFIFIFLSYGTNATVTSFDTVSIVKDTPKNQIFDVSSLNKAFLSQKHNSKTKFLYSFSFKHSFVIRSFNDQTTSSLSSSISQNTPMSLSFGGVFRLSNMVRFRTYLTALKYLDVVTQADEYYDEIIVQIPIELKFQTAFTFRSEILPLNYLVGLEYLKISSFDTEDLGINNSVSILEYSLYYLALGFTKHFKLFGINSHALVSYAISISTKNSNVGKPLTGEKFELSLKTQIWNSLFFHCIYEFQSLISKTELKTNKFGVGMGFSF